jgi:hypothetical protein
MKKWEVAVLPRHVLYEGETEEEVKVSYDEEWWALPDDHYWCVDTMFGKLDPWRMGLVAFQPTQEAVSSAAVQKSCRNKDPVRFLSAIAHR